MRAAGAAEDLVDAVQERHRQWGFLRVSRFTTAAEFAVAVLAGDSPTEQLHGDTHLASASRTGLAEMVRHGHLRPPGSAEMIPKGWDCTLWVDQGQTQKRC